MRDIQSPDWRDDVIADFAQSRGGNTVADNPSDLEALVKRVSEAGATYVGACALRLRSSARDRYLPFIAQEFPHLEERYRNTYAYSHHAGERYRQGLASFFAKLCAKYRMTGWSSGADDEGDGALDEHPIPPEQLQLPFPAG